MEAVLNQKDMWAACRHGGLDHGIVIPVAATFAGAGPTGSGAAVDKGCQFIAPLGRVGLVGVTLNAVEHGHAVGTGAAGCVTMQTDKHVRALGLLAPVSQARVVGDLGSGDAYIQTSGPQLICQPVGVVVHSRPLIVAGDSTPVVALYMTGVKDNFCHGFLPSAQFGHKNTASWRSN